MPDISLNELDRESRRSVNAYNKERAQRYDQYAGITMGDRRLQRSYLHGILQKQRFKRENFLDLGCGTGFFSEVFYDHKSDINGYLVDGSSEMLDLARERLCQPGRKLEFRHTLFGHLDWSAMPEFDVVFSGYAIHHLPDSEKWGLFKNIESQLCPGGAFILFDNFLPREKTGKELIEYLTCREIERKTHHMTPIDKIIETDRRIKEAEGDQEATYEETLQRLRTAGFDDVTPIFLDARYGGMIAHKP